MPSKHVIVVRGYVKDATGNSIQPHCRQLHQLRNSTCCHQLCAGGDTEMQSTYPCFDVLLLGSPAGHPAGSVAATSGAVSSAASVAGCTQHSTSSTAA
jgi:hypothetical protein